MGAKEQITSAQVAEHMKGVRKSSILIVLLLTVIAMAMMSIPEGLGFGVVVAIARYAVERAYLAHFYQEYDVIEENKKEY